MDRHRTVVNAWTEVNHQVLDKSRNNSSWDRNIKSRTVLGCSGQNPRIVTLTKTREESKPWSIRRPKFLALASPNESERPTTGPHVDSTLGFVYQKSRQDWASFKRHHDRTYCNSGGFLRAV